MSDGAFERGLTTLTSLVVLLITAGIIFQILNVALVVIIGLVLELLVGGFLLHLWGKDYMSRL